MLKHLAQGAGHGCEKGTGWGAREKYYRSQTAPLFDVKNEIATGRRKQKKRIFISLSFEGGEGEVI